MKQILWMLSFGLLLSACATTEKYEANLQTWIGSPEAELVRSWGPPDSFYESGESRYLTYHWSNSGVIPGTSPSYTSTLIGNTMYTNPIGGTPAIAYNNNCSTAFEVRSEKVVSWSWKGNHCVAE